MITSSAARGHPANPSRTATAPACIALPFVIVGSWQCCMKHSPVGATAASTRDIIPAVGTQSPSSLYATAPASRSRWTSVNSSPLRPFVAAATGNTRHTPVCAARCCTSARTSGLSSAGPVLGMQHTLVNPPETAAAVPVAMVSLCSCPGSRRCTCGSISPGVTMHPAASITRAAGVRVSPAPISAITPSFTATSHKRSVRDTGSITRPLAMRSVSMRPQDRSPHAPPRHGKPAFPPHQTPRTPPNHSRSPFRAPRPMLPPPWPKGPGDTHHRGVAQLGSAFDWGSKGRRFKSCHPDLTTEGSDRGGLCCCRPGIRSLRLARVPSASLETRFRGAGAPSTSTRCQATHADETSPS